MNDNQEKPRFKFGKGIFVLLIIISLSMLAYGVKCVTGIVLHTRKDTNVLKYNNNSEIDYEVMIYPNNYIKEAKLPFGKTYISELVKNISMTMKYSYSATKSLELTHQHKVIATIYGIYNEDPTNDDNPVIWEKEFVLKPLTSLSNVNNTEFTVSETFDIDIEKYNKEILSFMQHFEIPTVSYLEIKMPVMINGGNDEFSLSEENSVVARIPLTDKVLRVNAELDKTITKKIASSLDKGIKLSSDEILLHTVLIVTAIGLLFLAVSKLHTKKDNKTYQAHLQRIKEEYNEIIVETKNIVDIGNFRQVSITNYMELLNLSNSLLMPIMLYEREDVAWFYVIKDKIMYTYVLKDEKSA